MPTLVRFANCRIEIRALDHPPPHVHIVMADRRDNLVEIDGLAMRGQIPAREIAHALEWIILHREALRNEWRKYCP